MLDLLPDLPDKHTVVTTPHWVGTSDCNQSSSIRRRLLNRTMSPRTIQYNKDCTLTQPYDVRSILSSIRDRKTLTQIIRYNIPLLTLNPLDLGHPLASVY
jgi:hypothetical protein